MDRFDATASWLAAAESARAAFREIDSKALQDAMAAVAKIDRAALEKTLDSFASISDSQWAKMKATIDIAASANFSSAQKAFAAAAKMNLDSISTTMIEGQTTLAVDTMLRHANTAAALRTPLALPPPVECLPAPRDHTAELEQRVGAQDDEIRELRATVSGTRMLIADALPEGWVPEPPEDERLN